MSTSTRPTISEVIAAVTAYAPENLQESWDNSGVQVGAADNTPCTGVLVCVDATPSTVAEAIERGCNLIVAHHPLLFRGLKRISPGENVVQQTVIDALRAGITIYSAHTSLDSTRGGISARMAQMLGGKFLRPLAPTTPGADTGLGALVSFEPAITINELMQRICHSFDSPVIRHSQGREGCTTVSLLGLCGGSGGEFIPSAIAAGCQAYLSSDIRYHDFVDYGKRIFLLDIGHFESESCSKQIFYDVICEKFANFAVWKSTTERNSIQYKYGI
ncbi:MAG: Nif3-like dinuclear metal center hexameric protein [Muribaculaceae bacterium]|nr:Nif3-like dinuclear metal center hexameric protein [Muribaculaceae bacterium]